MKTISKAENREQSWTGAIAVPPQEFPSTPLKTITGTIPPGLRGTLYRNGPARLTRGQTRVGHWFDGDGAILGVHFTGTDSRALYRYVQTAGYQAEEAEGRLQFGGYGTLPPGPFWERFRKGMKNPANTSVIALPDKLLALWEGGHPHGLDLETLETFGLDNLDGLAPDWGYSAHPKRDPQTGEIYNFGISPGKNTQLHVYRSNKQGQIQQQATFDLDGMPLLHDFVMAGPYLIFVIPPVRMSVLPVLLHLKSFSDSLTWHPELGTQILVIDRSSLELVSRGEAEPWYQWHFGNGSVSRDGEISLDLARYEDFQTNQYLKEVATLETETAAKGTLSRVRLNPKTGKVIATETMVDRHCEFPSVDFREVGQEWRYTYLSLQREGVELGREPVGAIGRFDYQTGQLTEAPIPDNCYPSEPIYVPDCDQPEQGWVLTVVYDANQHQSQVWIFDGDRLEEEPECRLGLPGVIPLGFHGTWNPEKLS